MSERKRRDKASDGKKILHHAVDETCPTTCDSAEHAGHISAEGRLDRLDKFERIFLENKDKIRMPRPSNYPMNFKKARLWAQSHCDPDSIKFANLIVENSIYIPFSEFVEKLEVVCKSFCQHYAKGRHKIVLIIPWSTSKSNFWVSLLAYPILKPILFDIQFNITDVYNEYYGKSEKIVCVICDDCSYTGTQLMPCNALNPATTKYAGKPPEPAHTSKDWLEWNRTTTDHVRALEKKISQDHFSINLLIPYISTVACQAIAGNKIMMVSTQTQVFNIFREKVNINQFSQYVMREFEQTFQYHSSICSIYFDHKVADAISTFNKIFLLAPLFNCDNGPKSMHFIENCDVDKAGHSIDVYKTHLNVEDTGSDTCPRTFYKSIKYTLDGKDITHKLVESLFHQP